MEHLQKQLQIKEYKEDAEDCLKIYEKLKEINHGSVWESQWRILVDIKFKGFPYDDRTYKPSEIGYVFLRGIKNEVMTRINSAISPICLTEEIEKAANEFAEKHGFRVPYDGSNEFYDKVDVRASKDGFKAGAEFADKHWQEKTRWKSLETEPPELPTPFTERYLLIKHSGGDLFVKLLVSQISINYWLSIGFTHWKEIE